MKVPLSWLHEYCRPDLDASALADRLALTGTEVERVSHHGVASADGFAIGRVLSVEPHPDADRLRVCMVDLGGWRAAADRLRRAERRRRADGRRRAAGGDDAGRDAAAQGEAARRRVGGDDPRRGRDRRRHAARRDHGARRRPRARHPARRRAADRDRRAGAGDHAEPARLPRRLRRRPRGPRRDGRAARAGAVGRGPGPARPRWDARGDRGGRGDGALRALHRTRLRGRHDRALAVLAEGEADGGRAAADLQRRRHHQLRDAADRAAAARVRPRPHRRRPARRARRPPGRRAGDARRRDAQARSRHGRDLRRRRADFAGRRDGRRALGGPRRHDAGADGGRHVGRPEHPADLDAAGACAARRPRPLREGARARAGDGRAGGRDAADGGAVRRAGLARDARRRRRRTCRPR